MAPGVGLAGSDVGGDIMQGRVRGWVAQAVRLGGSGKVGWLRHGWVAQV